MNKQDILLLTDEDVLNITGVNFLDWVHREENELIRQDLAFEYIDTLRELFPFHSYEGFVKCPITLKIKSILIIKNKHEKTCNVQLLV